MKNFILFCFITFIFLKPAFSQTNLVNAINSFLIPIDTTVTNNGLEKLLPLVNCKKVIGLGEATHGTSEFFTFKHQLLKFLATSADVKTFIIEADFAGTEVMNDYVLYGKGNAYDALFDMGVGVWMTSEMIEMIEWIKTYNQYKRQEDKLKFYGCDMQSNYYAAIKVKGYLSQKKMLSPACESMLDSLINWKYKRKYSSDEKKLLTITIKSLNELSFNDSDTTNLKKIRQYIRVIEQNIEYMFKSGGYLKANLRDKFMAENCEWIYNFESKNKTIIWAHNSHISKHASSNTIQPMGKYLTDYFGKNYYAFGFAFSSGKLRAYNPEIKKYEIYDIPAATDIHSSDNVFSKCNYTDFIFDFNSAIKNKKIMEFLNSKVFSRNIGARYFQENVKSENYIKQRLYKSYDGIVFFRETNASKSLVK